MSNEVNLRIALNNDTLLGLISEKLAEDNGGESVNINSVWNQILDVVDEQQQESGNVYSGGSERKNWRSNYVLAVGKTVTFTKELWDKIKRIAGLSSEQQTVSVRQQSGTIPEEIDLTSGDYASKKITNPDGRSKYVVTVEGKNVRYTSMDMEYNSKGKLMGYIQHFPEGDMAYDAKNRLLPNGVHAVETFRNEEQQAEYTKALNDAKVILLDPNNIKELGLSDEEVELIRKIDIESIDFGAARYDSSAKTLLFNINDRNVPNESEFVKVIIHELTHATRGNLNGNSQEEERTCETRAIKSALKLIQSGKMKSFMLPNGTLPPIDISTLITDNMIDNYVNNWLVQQGYDKRLPLS